MPIAPALPATTPWAKDVAQQLLAAVQRRQPIANLQAQGLCTPDTPLQQAYSAQDALLDLRRERGGQVAGYKIAVTQPAKLRALGLQAPLVGVLLTDEAIADGGELERDTLIRPRLEPEIAFVLGRPLEGSGRTLADALAAVEYVAPAFEIIDSRYEVGAFHPFSAVADNVSSARHVLGPPQSPGGLDLPHLGCLLRRDGDIVGTGAGGQVFGHPALALVALADFLAARGQRLEAGMLVLSGGLIEALPLQPGEHWRASLHSLGEVGLQVV